MKAKIRSLAWSCLALLCGAASAQIRDGAYTGTLECGPLITNPQQGAWKQPININVTGQSVTWERPDPRITEVGSSTLRDRRVSFTLEGRWNPGQRNTGQWRNVVMLEWKDSVLSGPATIFSANGEQRLRDCSVRVAMVGSTDTSAAVTLQRNAGAAISSAATGKLANAGDSVASKLQPAAAVPATVLESPAQPHRQAQMAQRSADPAAMAYEAAQAKLRADEKARQNRAPVPITPDMCVDGVCVEQDLGAVAANLNWAPPEPMDQIPSSHRKAYEDGIRQGMQTCEQANQPLWADKARKLCDFLILGPLRPKADLVAFFKENRQAVCVTGSKYFKLQIKTALGPTYVEVRFSRDGRPRIKEISKEFQIKNKDDLAELSAQMRKKHPYIVNSTRAVTAPWGGNVSYDDGYALGPSYRLEARSVLFDPREEPNEGSCTPARKTITVQ